MASEGWRWEPPVEVLDAMMNEWFKVGDADNPYTTESLTAGNLLQNREILAVVLKAALAEMREEVLIRAVRAQVYEEERDRWLEIEAHSRGKNEALAATGRGSSDVHVWFERKANHAAAQAQHYNGKVQQELAGGDRLPPDLT